MPIIAVIYIPSPLPAKALQGASTTVRSEDKDPCPERSRGFLTQVRWGEGGGASARWRAKEPGP